VVIIVRSPRHVSNDLGVLRPLIIKEDGLRRLSFYLRSNIDFSFSLIVVTIINKIVD
jgi:hypothetical protein